MANAWAKLVCMQGKKLIACGMLRLSPLINAFIEGQERFLSKIWSQSIFALITQTQVICPIIRYGGSMLFIYVTTFIVGSVICVVT
jgi:hypothetical protein